MCCFDPLASSVVNNKVLSGSSVQLKSLVTFRKETDRDKIEIKKYRDVPGGMCTEFLVKCFHSIGISY